MKKALYCMRLDAHVYLMSGRIILPLLALIAYLGIFYATAPFDIVGSYAMSSAAVFFVAMSLGLSYSWTEDVSFSQILSIKMGYVLYTLVQTTSVLFCSLTVGLIAVVYPYMMSLIRVGFFTRAVTMQDILGALTLNLLASTIGGAFAMVFNPRIISDRKLAYVLCLLIGLMGFFHGFMGIPVWISFILPPIYEYLNLFSRADVFIGSDLLNSAFRLSAYLVIMIGIRTILLMRRRY